MAKYDKAYEDFATDTLLAVLCAFLAGVAVGKVFRAWKSSSGKRDEDK